MIDLVEFLLARIAEDEAVAKAGTPGRWQIARDTHDRRPYVRSDDDVIVLDAGGEFCGDLWLSASDEDLAHVVRWDPVRVLAECAARRRLIEEHPVYPDGDQHECPGTWVGYQDDPGEPCPTLRVLALPYAGHSDYRQEWAPWPA